MNDPGDEISFVDPQIQLCPFPAYKKLQQQTPVYRDPKTGFFELLTFENLRVVAQDAKTYSSEHPVYGDRSLTPAHQEAERLYREEGYLPIKTLINADEPEHKMYRDLVDRSFKPARVRSIEPYIKELAHMLIDRFADRSEAEFITEFAIPLPLYVIADTIGVSRENAANFKRWSDALMKVHEPGISGEMQIALTREVIEMQHFFADALDQAKLNPKEDIIGDLATAEVDGRLVNTREAVAMLESILVAGNESTASAIGNAMRRLIENPDIEARLRTDPSLIPAFTEEVLRLDAPLQCQYRRPVKDVRLSGVDVPADSMIVLRFGAGNRDAGHYDDPDSIKLDRPQIRQHLTFGVGIHSCLGVLLARAELRIAVEAILQRFASFRLAGEPTASPSYMVYGLSSLPIAFEKA